MRFIPTPPRLASTFACCLIAATSSGLIQSARADDDAVCSPARYSMDGYERAGYPQEIACRALPSNTRAYDGYTVGGGAAFHGQPRYLNEGTWGWDYVGLIIQRRVGLDWWHGQHAQGGPGAYKTDGPKLVH